MIQVTIDVTGFLARHKISAKDYGKRFLKKARGPWAGSRKGRDMFLVQVSIATIIWLHFETF